MDNKELNIAIYKSLAAKAAELFRRTKIDAGTYSAKELSDGKKDKKALCWEMENSKEEITISVESFVCRFAAWMVFAILSKFEKLVPAKDRVKFTKCEETAGLVCSFTMDVTKSAIDAAKFVAKTNGYRPVMENVCIDIQGERLTAYDGYKMAIRPVAIINVSGELLERRAFIRPNDLKNIVGRCEVRIYEKENTYQTEVTTERGETYICECGGRFPNVDSISWQPEENQAIRFADLKELKKIAKDTIKSDCKLQIITDSGRKSARIVARNSEEQCFEYSVLLSEPANYSCIVWIKPETLTPFFGDWTGELYIKSAYSAFVLGSKSGYNLLMPTSLEEGEEIKDPEYPTEPVKVAETAKTFEGERYKKGRTTAQIATAVRKEARKSFPEYGVKVGASGNMVSIYVEHPLYKDFHCERHFCKFDACEGWIDLLEWVRMDARPENYASTIAYHLVRFSGKYAAFKRMEFTDTFESSFIIRLEFVEPDPKPEPKRNTPSTELQAERMEPAEKTALGTVLVSPSKQEPSTNLIELPEQKNIAPALITPEPVSISNWQIIVAIWLLGLFAIRRKLGMAFLPLSARINIPSTAPAKALLSPDEIHIRAPGKDVVIYQHKIRNISDGKLKHIEIYRARGPDVIFNYKNSYHHGNWFIYLDRINHPPIRRIRGSGIHCSLYVSSIYYRPYHGRK